MQTAIKFDQMRLPPETEALRADVRAFLADEIARGTFDPGLGLKQTGFDRGFSQRVGQKGWIGMTWPKQYGGQERTHLDRYVVTEEMRAASAPTWSHFVADRQSGPVILKYGTDALKEEILPKIVSGRSLLCHRDVRAQFRVGPVRGVDEGRIWRATTTGSTGARSGRPMPTAPST